MAIEPSPYFHKQKQLDCDANGMKISNAQGGYMNAETFPKVAPKQVVVIQAEHATGILLDQHFKHYKGHDGQEKYRVFDSLEMANAYIDKLKADLNLEFVVYNYKQEVICKINM
ncbi:MAG: hypothetical protein LBT26_11915 [Clostridiales Family XIII bacterium]|jgi:hypothetical protein|nr:hypothetical protein [Clostridiales Family XIII bacterium]